MSNFNDILRSIHVLPKEYIPTANALGRVVAEPIKARTSLPEVDVAAVDGYALHCADLEHSSLTLSIQGESNSARPFRGIFEKGSAIKTYAGGRIVAGADTLVALHNAIEKDGCITLQSHPIAGENICPAGIDFSPEEDAFLPGTIFNSRLVGLASTMHLLWVPVVRKPRVAIMAVGSELSLPGEATAESPITASSLYTLPANVVASGGDPVILGVTTDSLDNIEATIEQAKGCDLLITTGGTSAGAGNLMRNVLNKMAEDISTLSVELKRNDCMFFSRYKGMPICSLPGNPISSSIYFSLFTRRIINKMIGIAAPRTHRAILGRNLDEHDTSVAYLHASLSVDSSGTYKVIPVSAQDGFLLTALTRADCLLVVNQNTSLKKGDFVEYIPLAHSMIST